MVVHTKEGERLYRISPWAKYVTKGEKSVIYDWVHWDPPQPYIVSYWFHVLFFKKQGFSFFSVFFPLVLFIDLFLYFDLKRSKNLVKEIV